MVCSVEEKRVCLERHVAPSTTGGVSFTARNGDTRGPWRVLSSVVTYRDKWITLRSDHCITPHGIEVAPFHVIEFPDWVNVVALTKASRKLVLVKEYRHGMGEVQIGLVSGSVEEVDTLGHSDSAMRAAERELREETGFASASGAFIHLLSSFANAANQNNILTSFMVLDAELVHEPKHDPSEVVDTILMEFPAVLRDARKGRLRMQSYHVAALWSAAVAIAGGREEADIEPDFRRAVSKELVG